MREGMRLIPSRILSRRDFFSLLDKKKSYLLDKKKSYLLGKGAQKGLDDGRVLPGSPAGSISLSTALIYVVFELRVGHNWTVS